MMTRWFREWTESLSWSRADSIGLTLIIVGIAGFLFSAWAGGVIATIGVPVGIICLLVGSVQFASIP